MDSTHIAYHKCFIYAICFILFSFPNKAFKTFTLAQRLINIVYTLLHYTINNKYNKLPQSPHTTNPPTYTKNHQSYHYNLLEKPLQKKTSHPHPKPYPSLRGQKPTSIILLMWLAYLPITNQTNHIYHPPYAPHPHTHMDPSQHKLPPNTIPYIRHTQNHTHIILRPTSTHQTPHYYTNPHIAQQSYTYTTHTTSHKRSTSHTYPTYKHTHNAYTTHYNTSPSIPPTNILNPIHTPTHQSQDHLKKLTIPHLTYLMNRCPLGIHKWFLALIGYIVFLLYNKTSPLPKQNKPTSNKYPQSHAPTNIKIYHTYNTLVVLTIIIIYTHTHTLTSYKSPIPTPHHRSTQTYNHKSTITSTHQDHTHSHNTHDPPKYQAQHKIYTPMLPIITTSLIGHIQHITHLHLKTPKTINIHYYSWNNSTLIILSGDVKPNPGPLAHILDNLPREFTQRQKQYFIPNTITLKHQYTHLAELFKPYLSLQTHSIQNQDLPHLRNQSLAHATFPTHFQIYAFIITYSPIPQTCNQLMAENIDQDCLTILQRLQQLPTSTYLRKYPITTQPSPNITPTTITQAYTHINEKIAKGEILTITNLQTELPHLPQKITQELIKCTQQVKGYTPNTNPNTTNYTQTNTTSEANPQATT